MAALLSTLRASGKVSHASKHAAESEHPIVESFQPGENWRWCYVDRLYL